MQKILNYILLLHPILAIISSKSSTLRSVAGGLIGEAAIGGAKGFFSGAAAFDKVKQQSQIKSFFSKKRQQKYFGWLFFVYSQL